MVEKAWKGDMAALEDLCHLHWEPVYHYFYYRVQNKEEAEELTQETFYRVLRSLPRVQNPASFISYLFKTASNLLAGRYRSLKKLPEKVELEVVDLPNQRWGDPEEQALIKEQRQKIQEGLKSLSKDYQKVLQLRLIKGLSVQKAALIMGRSEGAIRILQFRALQVLRKNLGSFFF